jgi:hypothetical protein
MENINAAKKLSTDLLISTQQRFGIRPVHVKTTRAMLLAAERKGCCTEAAPCSKHDGIRRD